MEDEVRRRSLGPPRGHLGCRETVEGRVDLDDVEVVGVVAEPRLGARDAPWIPVLDEPFVGPAAGPDPDGRRDGASAPSSDPVEVLGREQRAMQGRREPR